MNTIVFGPLQESVPLSSIFTPVDFDMHTILSGVTVQTAVDLWDCIVWSPQPL